MDRPTSMSALRWLSLAICSTVATVACYASPGASLARQSATAPDADLQQRIEALKAKTLRDLVPIKGGTFTMGDFGPIDPRAGMPYTGQRDDDVLREVTLSDYAMGAYKVTYAEFDVFTEATGKPKVAQQEMDLAYRDLPGIPAGVNWYDAQAYCQWIGKQIGKAMDLPTEAQWEYAARNRGQMVVWPTDNGEVENGRNVANFEQQKKFSSEHPGALMTPIGDLPATPLGLYDVIDHGFEWIRDWYAPEYDPKNNHNPQGPNTGSEKVLRSHSDWGGEGLAVVSMTMTRFNRSQSSPPRKSPIDNSIIPSNQNHSTAFRCIAENY